MCKVLMIAGIKDSTRENAIKFMKAMAVPMSVSNSDGLGYAAVTKDNKLFSERWLVNKDAFTYNKDAGFYSKYQDITEEEIVSNYSSYGTIDLDNVIAITMHTRMATSAKGMENTHPFIKDGVSVIHNGIIDNVYDFKLEQSSCDSETILLQYHKSKIKTNPENMTEFASNLKGYYACGILAPSPTGYVMDIFRGNNNFLSFAFIDELDTVVFTTSPTDLEQVCKQLNFTMRSPLKIKEGLLVRLNAATGDVVLTKTFKVRSRLEADYYNTNKFWKSNTKPELPTTSTLPKHIMDYLKSSPGVCEEIIYAT